jgi:hypothetical protein
VGKKDSRKINVEIAPANRRKLDGYISSYNQKPDRATPVLKYTDVINEALHLFFESRPRRST